MLGTEDQPGIMMLSIDELFRSIEEYSAERDYMLKVSYVEVYNENIKDLLIEKADSEYLDLREDAVKGVMVAGVTEIMTTNVEEIDHYIR
jgi:kinesin family protein 18/19